MQGRFKRDDSAAAEPEPRGGTDRGSTPQRAQGAGSTPENSGTLSPARPGPPGAGDSAEPPQTRPAQGSGSRMALRNWRISTRLVSLLTLPVVAATSLGALRIETSMDNLQQLENMKLLTEMTKQATELASALQEERDHSAGPLATGDDKNDDVVYSRIKTDRAKQSFREATQDIEASNSEALVGVNSSLVNILKQLEKIKTIRATAYDDSEYIAQTAISYNELITSLLSLSQDMAQATSNSEMIRSTRALAAFSSAKEYASIQRAVIAAGLAHEPKPKLSANDRLYGQSAQQSEESAIAQFSQVYGGSKASSQELLQALEDGGNSEIILADTYAARVLKTDGQISNEKRSYKDWYDQDSTKIDEMSRIEQTLLSEMEEKARELRSEAQQEAILNGAIILLVLGVSLVGAFVVARSMVRSLRRLQDTAQDVSQKRLPELVKQLSESDPQDVDTSVKSVGVHSRDEIGRVAAAFDDVHREAVRLAAEQALLRGNVNAMFTNLSRRSQGLIQRQLSLISELESREADPDQLSSLFKLDHLATRMRRNGENLLVLAGEEPGRRWTRPVPLVDVLRAAASEVEQYERIELSAVPTTEVAGRVVNDLVHLLAELLENATSFSSPQTKVKVTGHALPDGRVLVEIHDTGIGLSPEDLAAINERLASPPTVDVSVSRRMGLFVVGRLSLRHGIRIQLRPSDSGGTTALVMLPVDVAQGGAKAAGKPAPPVGGSGGASTPGTSRLAGMTPRSQVTGGGARAALPSRDPGGAQGGPGGNGPGSGGPGSGGQQGRTGNPLPSRPTAGAGTGNAFAPGGRPGGTEDTAQSRDSGAFSPAGRPGSGPGRPGGSAPAGNAPGSRTGMPPAGPGRTDDQGRAPALPPRPGASDGRGSTPTVASPSGAPSGGPAGRGPSGSDRGGRPQLPPRGPAAELPGGSGGPGTQEPGTSWGARRAAGSDDWPTTAPRDNADTPRGHEDVESTTQFPRPDYDEAPQQREPQQQRQQQQPQESGQFALPPSELDGPPTSGGDGRTPLFDTLESDWFRGGGRLAERPGRTQGQPSRSVPQQPSGRPASPVPPQQSAPPQREQREQREPARGQNGSDAWRSSPNDELGRQAERVRQPASGGVTTSGLPRRVPRANLVAGTASQQQTHPTSPQVSRAPDDVRGRLTNLRRGIQRGRQAGTDGHDSNNQGFGPTYQQER
ncbi:nitrate- and nitrite sensing domain-containing protein [Streptomyces sp. NPDC047108]|uniref:nitrate- and nitrite sensing domain-containing protein n=1 Tax=Streptomyces sp. NPDC047108 TaxID=3155025 RepID=UPI00340B56E1